MNSPVSKAVILAAKSAKERASFTAWVKERLRPDDQTLVLIEKHRRLWLAMEIQQ